LATLVVPNIINHARLTEEVCNLFGWPCKLTLKQCLLNFLLYFKHDNVTIHDAFMWNWSKISICDDVIFIWSCINEGIANEIQWLIVKERVTFASGIRDLPSCMRFIDGTLVETCNLWNNVTHQTWFNGRKKSTWWTTWSLLTTKVSWFTSTLDTQGHGMM
jgi:hypothetical protein